MTEVLHYESRKFGPYSFDISTPEKRDRAYLALFLLFDAIGFYDQGDMRKHEQALYDEAKGKQCAKSAEKLLIARKNGCCEYETEWDELELLSTVEQINELLRAEQAEEIE